MRGYVRSAHLLNRIFRRDDLARDSFIMVIFGLSGGLFNGLYQILMGRMLTRSEYGTVVSLLSISMIAFTLAQTIQTSTTKFASTLRVHNDVEGIRYQWRFSLIRTLVLGAAAFILVAFLSPLLSRFLGIDTRWPVVTLSLSFLLTFALPVGWGILGGLQRFLSLGMSTALWALLKLVIAVLLVYLGFGVCGGLASIPVAYLLTFAITVALLGGFAKPAAERREIRGLFSYTALTSIAIVSFSILVNIDVLLAKHYFDADAAGNYSAISVLGRIALYAAAGVALAMFPKTSDISERGGMPQGILVRATIYTLVPGGAVVLLYLLLASPVVQVLFGDKYPVASADLVRYTLGMLCFAVSFLMMNYCLSLNRTKSVYVVALTLFLEIALIVFFHSSISQFVNIILVCGVTSVLLLLPFCVGRNG